MHYEVEQASHDVGVGAEPERWHAVNALNADAVPMPLRFDTLEQALAYTLRVPGPLRVVEVTDEGGRVPVDTGTP